MADGTLFGAAAAADGAEPEMARPGTGSTAGTAVGRYRVVASVAAVFRLPSAASQES